MYNFFRLTRAFALVTIIGLLCMSIGPATVWAVTDPALTGGSPVTGVSGSATPITDLQVAGTNNPTVPVKLRVTSGTLAMSTTTGLTFSGGSTGSTLQFSGLMSDVNAALATLAYTRTGAGTDTLEASLVNAGEVFFPGNGHLYEYVSSTLTWTAAKTAAEGRTKYGAAGYLTTITSQSENDFVSARLLNAGWMGASDAAVEGNWKWVTGPENGTQFWSGSSTGATVNGQYANWNGGEPNDSGGNEDCGQFLSGGTGKWNDLPCTVTTLPGYVVEYGSDSSPISISSLNVSITTLAANVAPNVPVSLGPSEVTNGSWSAATQPTLNFNLTDPDVSNTVKYQVQVSTQSNFSSSVIDYTSALAAQGVRSFTVGQASGSGSYAVGSAGQTLSDSSYYWRVKTIDVAAASSSYTTANGGSVAFKVDTTAPVAPVELTTTSPTQDTTPTWTWTAAVDTGSGLASPAYIIEWSPTVDFTIDVQSATTDAASYTHSVSLADGVWYARVKAIDAAGNVSAYVSGSVQIDTSLPSISAVNAVAAGSSVTISWTTNKPTSSQIAFGATSSYGLLTTMADTLPRVTSHSVTISGLSSCTAFHYQVKAEDVFGQLTQSTDHTFTTRACPTPTPTPVTTVISTPLPTPTSIVSTSSPKANVTVSSLTPTPTPPTFTPTPTPSSISTSGNGTQTVTITVRDANGHLVKDATVTLHSTPRVAKTNDQGVATFLNVEPGEHSVEVAYGGKTEQQHLTVAANTNVKSEVKLAGVTVSQRGWWSWWYALVVPFILLLIWIKRRAQQDQPRTRLR